jgi:exosortase B
MTAMTAPYLARVPLTDRRAWPLLLVLLGLLVMYVPSFYDLLHGAWSTDKNAHGPIVFAVALWFFYFRASSLDSAGVAHKPAPMLGYPILCLGLLSFVIGRSQSVLLLEVGSLVLVLLGAILTFFGRAVARHLWFGFFFMCFMVPLPGSLVDAVTQPLKVAVSYSAENMLFHMNYPIARSGVILQIGQYQLLVADACSGLNSLRHESAFRNILLALLIVPISFVSNVTRVIVLALITYHMGDAAGQGFLHGFSGMVLFLCGLVLIISLDTLLRSIAVAYQRYRARAH